MKIHSDKLTDREVQRHEQDQVPDQEKDGCLMEIQEAVNNVRDWIKRLLIAAGDDPDINVTIYTCGISLPGHEVNEKRSEATGLRVAEVDVTAKTGSGSSGAAWMQVEPSGLAVCAEVERCVIAQLEDWDSVQDGEIRDEFWRLGRAMLGSELTTELWESVQEHTPGKPYI